MLIKNIFTAFKCKLLFIFWRIRPANLEKEVQYCGWVETKVTRGMGVSQEFVQTNIGHGQSYCESRLAQNKKQKRFVDTSDRRLSCFNCVDMYVFIFQILNM